MGMSKSPLEAQLEAITREFVFRIVTALRNSSLADVAGLQAPSGSVARRTASVERAKRPLKEPVRNTNPAGKPRQTADHRAELGARVLEALEHGSEPMGLRAIATAVGVPSALLAAPLLELRAAGRIKKQGERRTTIYSAV
jgi:predicted Rossmann fold nucleotide-binding protein DprA/Smf involved in DNA uptake